LHLLTQPRILRQDEISDQLEISKPAVSRALDSLEQKGLVIRERDSADRRISHVELTARARELGRQIEAIYDEVFAIAAQGVAPADIDTAVSFFALISENFSRAKEQLKGGKGHD
jgi:DNA-binding MarR family transcriptional regulator